MFLKGFDIEEILIQSGIMQSGNIIIENNKITEMVELKDCTEGAGHFHFYK